MRSAHSEPANLLPFSGVMVLSLLLELTNFHKHDTSKQLPTRPEDSITQPSLTLFLLFLYMLYVCVCIFLTQEAFKTHTHIHPSTHNPAFSKEKKKVFPRKHFQKLSFYLLLSHRASAKWVLSNPPPFHCKAGSAWGRSTNAGWDPWARQQRVPVRLPRAKCGAAPPYHWGNAVLPLALSSWRTSALFRWTPALCTGRPICRAGSRCL